MATDYKLLFQALRNSRMAVKYSLAASQEAVNLQRANLQKARQRFCKHPVISLSEANYDDQVRVARAKVPDHRVKPEECCPTCNSSVQCQC